MIEEDLKKENFFLEGSKSYFNVQVAIDRYQKIIETEIKNILKRQVICFIKSPWS